MRVNITAIVKRILNEKFQSHHMKNDRFSSHNSIHFTSIQSYTHTFSSSFEYMSWKMDTPGIFTHGYI